MTVAESTHEHDGHGHDAHGHDHPAHLAHHFESPQQQFDAGKLGIWMFLITEVLFFSGMFCAYAVYRALHPEIFTDAAKELDAMLGALNTVVLIVSSLTMAWAVRAAQLSQKKLLIVLLWATLALAGVFLIVKTIEYTTKFEHELYPGIYNHFTQEQYPTVADKYVAKPAPAEEAGAHDAAHASTEEAGARQHADEHAHDGEHGHEGDHGHGHGGAEGVRNIHIFFGIYYMMTGIHAIHIIGGMGAIGWLIWRAHRGEFSSEYFGPVDYVGLYWHLVDLIWIYLFPLLYLIH
ncbi:MAG: cytochrome c oxidase subunit 3 family protein [Blastopirellula sp. JB062]